MKEGRNKLRTLGENVLKFKKVKGMIECKKLYHTLFFRATFIRFGFLFANWREFKEV